MNKPNIRYLAIDLDGTLLASNKTIDEETVGFLNRCIKHGYKIILVSGRHFKGIQPYLRLLGLSFDDVVISCDGEYIMRCDGSIVWDSLKLHIKDVEIIKQILDRRSFTIVTPAKDYVIIPSIYKRLKSRIISFILRREFNVNQQIPYDADLSVIEKVVIDNKLEKEKLYLLNDRYTCHSLEESVCQILPIRVNKYEALLELEKQKIINLNETMYLGNDENDLECFSNLKYCVAMGNSVDVIKEKAFYLADTNDNKGVLKALKFFLPI